MKNTLGQKIKELRAQKGYSQEQLANLTELSLRTVQRIENGETEPRGDSLIRLANAFGVTPNDLIDWQEQEDRGFLAFMNLSALSFIVFPLFGVIIPLALWIFKKEKIKDVNVVGKKLLNFQITIGLFLYVWYAIPFAMLIFKIRDMNNGMISPPKPGLVPFLMFLGLAFYLFNVVMIIVNAMRSYKTGEVFYRPAIRFLK